MLREIEAIGTPSDAPWNEFFECSPIFSIANKIHDDQACRCSQPDSSFTCFREFVQQAKRDQQNKKSDEHQIEGRKLPRIGRVLDSFALSLFLVKPAQSSHRLREAKSIEPTAVKGGCKSAD